MTLVKRVFHTKRRFLIVVAGIMVLAIVWHLWRCSQGKECVGIYLADGGRSLFAIEHHPLKGLTVSEGYMLLTPKEYGLYNVLNRKVRASYRGGELQVSQISSLTAHLSTLKYLLNVFLTRSTAAVGDWDLVEARFDGNLTPSLLSEGVARILKSAWQSGSIRNSLRRNVTHERYDRPIRSFLHRIDDPRLVDYFKSRRENDYSADQWALLKGILQDHPNDPYLLLHDIEFEAVLGNPEQAKERLIDLCKNDQQTLPDVLRPSIELLTSTVSMANARKQGYDPNSLRVLFAGTRNDTSMAPLERRLEWLKGLLQYDTLTPDSIPLVANIRSQDRYVLPNYLEIKTIAKVCAVRAVFGMVSGKNTEALKLAAACYRLGQSMNAGGQSINRTNGTMLRGMATEVFRIYVLNACTTPRDLEECQSFLDSLRDTWGQATDDYLWQQDYDSSLVCELFPRDESPDGYDLRTYQRAVDMRFELVRAAVAARYHRIESGEFPISEKEFAPLLPDGLPQDVYSGGPMKFVKKNDDLYSIYSVGPDRIDDTAAIEYDSTNGTITRGDIFIDIPREREFPFPRDGVLAQNAAELLAQFPNGLPLDPFVNTKVGKRPLSVIESTDTTGVKIVSIGPDLEYPSPPETANLLPLPADASRNRSLQGVFLPSNETPAPTGHWTLQPYYDPTNGTTSAGDLFMEIPR